MEIGGGELHLWLASPEAFARAQLQHCQQLLSAAERERAARFHFERDRRLYLVAHGLLRVALSSYSTVSPEDWEFATGFAGKPFVVAPLGAPPLSFNLSHTSGLAVCGIAAGQEIGVDVESLDPPRDLASFAGQFLSPGEQREIEPLSGAARVQRLYEYWVVKEAYAKACGWGLSLSLPEITLVFSPEGNEIFLLEEGEREGEEPLQERSDGSFASDGLLWPEREGDEPLQEKQGGLSFLSASHSGERRKERSIEKRQSWYLSLVPLSSSHKLAVAFPCLRGASPVLQQYHLSPDDLP